MTDTTDAPAAGHNQPSARGYLTQMRHAAHLFVTNDHASEAHLLTLMEHAYRLRSYREENDTHRDEVDGLLGKRKIADTARTSPFTRLLKNPRRSAGRQEPHQPVRCGGSRPSRWCKSDWSLRWP